MCPPAEWRRSVTCQKHVVNLFFRHPKVRKMFSPCKTHVSSSSRRHAHADKNAADKQRRICTIGTCISMHWKINHQKHCLDIEQEQNFKDFIALKVYECQKLINSHINYYEGEAQCDVQVFVINNMFNFQCHYHFWLEMCRGGQGRVGLLRKMGTMILKLNSQIWLFLGSI